MNQRLHRRLAVSLALVLGAWTAPVFGVEEKEVESAEWAALTLKMESEGWQQVAPKVFERQVSGTKTEHLGYGEEGLAWTIGSMNQQLDRLMVEFERTPTLELAETIEKITAAISRAHQDLRALARGGGLQAAPQALDGPSCDGVCYSATADAYHQTAQQGVGATAVAKFNNPCGYTGDTLAYVFVQATQGTTTSQFTQNDPRTGSNITSTAQGSLAGGSISGFPCSSTASATVWSSLLGFSYSTIDVNDGICPVPVTPIAASIVGTSYEFFTNLTCRSRTWTASVTNGVAPISYQWKVNGALVGTGSSYTRSICPAAGSFTLAMTATGANAQSSTSSRTVLVEYEPIGTCGGTTRIACP